MSVQQDENTTPVSLESTGWLHSVLVKTSAHSFKRFTSRLLILSSKLTQTF